MKTCTTSAALMAVLSLTCSNAFALVATTIPAGPAVFSGFSAERVIDRNGNFNILDVGDSLHSIFTLNMLGGVLTYGAGTTQPELTGIAQVLVFNKIATATPNLFKYTLGPDPVFGLGAGKVAALYEDAANDFTRVCANFAACDGTANGGSLLATFGMASGFWDVMINDDLAVGAVLPPGTLLGAFSMGLDFTTNNTGIVWSQVNCVDPFTGLVHSVDVCGTGTFDASGRNTVGGPATPYDVFDPFEFRLNRVPEPATIALMGFGMLALSATRRRGIAAKGRPGQHEINRHARHRQIGNLYVRRCGREGREASSYPD